MSDILNKRKITKFTIFLITVFYFLSLKYQGVLLEHFALVGSNYAEHTDFYRFFTVALLHANFTHYLFNALALYQLGSIIEIRLNDSKFFLLFMSMTLLFSSLASWLFMKPNGASVGASGMIFGFLGYFYLIHKEYRVSSTWLNFILLFNLSMPFFIKSIDYRAHLGGLFSGIIVGKILEHYIKNKKNS